MRQMNRRFLGHFSTVPGWLLEVQIKRNVERLPNDHAFAGPAGWCAAPSTLRGTMILDQATHHHPSPPLGRQFPFTSFSTIYYVTFSQNLYLASPLLRCGF